MNGWQDQFVRPNGLVADDLSPTLAANLGLNQTGTARRGYSEVLVEQTSPSVVLPDVTLGATAPIYLVYYELEIRASEVTSARINVVDGSGNVLSSVNQSGLSSSYTLARTRPTSFAVVTTSPARNRISLGITVTGGTYSVRNAKLLVVSLNI